MLQPSLHFWESNSYFLILVSFLAVFESFCCVCYNPVMQQWPAKTVRHENTWTISLSSTSNCILRFTPSLISSSVCRRHGCYPSRKFVCFAPDDSTCWDILEYKVWSDMLLYTWVSFVSFLISIFTTWRCNALEIAPLNLNKSHFVMSSKGKWHPVCISVQPFRFHLWTRYSEGPGRTRTRPRITPCWVGEFHERNRYVSNQRRNREILSKIVSLSKFL